MRAVPRPGETIGPYRVRSLLGAGGMGAVFLAESPRGEKVAVKVLKNPSPEHQERFFREARLLRLLGEKDGFVPILDEGSTPEGPFIVMPFVPGGTLRKRLEGGPLSVEETEVLARELARALGRAHARGIVHRDLKPENVLFSKDGRALVADLGLAKHFRKDAPGASVSASLSRAGELRGTAGYMSPEQARDAKTAGPETDVFALGAILHECLAGTPAFGGANLLEVLAAVETCRPSPLEEVRPEAGKLIPLIEKALAHDAKDRFEDGDAFARALAPRRERARRLLAPMLVLVGVAAVVAARSLTRPPPRPEGEPVLDASPLVSAAAVKLATRDLKGARDLIGKALEREPACVSAFVLRAEVSRREALAQRELSSEQRDFARALDDASRAIALAPSRGTAWLARARVHASRDDLASNVNGPSSEDRATRDAARAFSLDSRLGEALAIRAFSGKVPEDLDRAVSIEPSSPFPWYWRGRWRTALEDWKGAVSDLERAQALLPGDLAILEALATARTVLDPQGALRDVERALELAPSHPRALKRRGKIHIYLNEFSSAASDLGAVLEQRPGDGVAFFDRGIARSMLGDHDGGIADETRAMELRPDSPDAFVWRARIKNRKRDAAGAFADYDAILTKWPGSVEAWRMTGQLALQKNDLEEAKRRLSRAIDLDGNDRDALASRSTVLEKQGDAAGAVRDIDRFLEIVPPNDARVAAMKSRRAKLTGARVR